LLCNTRYTPRCTYAQLPQFLPAWHILFYSLLARSSQSFYALLVREGRICPRRCQLLPFGLTRSGAKWN
jgi:hypothetical protein